MDAQYTVKCASMCATHRCGLFDDGHKKCTQSCTQLTNNWVQSKINFLVGPQEPLLATVKRWKLAWFRHTTRHDGLSKTILRAPWRVGYAIVGRANVGWKMSKGGQPCLCQNFSQGPPAEKTGRGSLLNRPPCSHDDPISQGRRLN